MKKLLVALGIVAAAGLLGFAAVWACCGGAIILDVRDIADTPDPVPCQGKTTISYTVVGEMNLNLLDKVMTQLDIMDGTTLIWSSGPTQIGTINLDDWDQWTDTWPASFDWVPGAADDGKTYTYDITAWVQDAAGNSTVVYKVVAAGTITTEPCCVEGIEIEVTPQTFDVTRSGNYVTAHVILPPGAPLLENATIIKIGDYDVSIPGTVRPDTTIAFSSAEFAKTAALIVKAGDPRAMDIEVRVDIDLADPVHQPCDQYYADKIDIINQGKTKN